MPAPLRLAEEVGQGLGASSLLLRGVQGKAGQVGVDTHFPYSWERTFWLPLADGFRREAECSSVRPPCGWNNGRPTGMNFERHRSLWTAVELRGAGFEVLEAGEPDRFGNPMLLAVGQSDSPPVG